MLRTIRPQLRQREVLPQQYAVVFPLPVATAAALLEIQESAFRVRLSRALRRVEEFLVPRCEHVTRENPCSCASRRMIVPVGSMPPGKIWRWMKSAPRR